MSRAGAKPKVRCAIYCRKSSEEGLEQSFNSLDAQREACAAYITASAMKAGSRSTIGTTMAATAAARWSDRRCSG
jgi:hypothetical protein